MPKRPASLQARLRPWLRLRPRLRRRGMGLRLRLRLRRLAPRLVARLWLRRGTGLWLWLRLRLRRPPPPAGEAAVLLGRRLRRSSLSLLSRLTPRDLGLLGRAGDGERLTLRRCSFGVWSLVRQEHRGL